MIAQEIFDKVFEHLVRQGRQSIGGALGTCRYRLELDSGEVLKCAIGCLIPDELYSPEIEGLTVRGLFAGHHNILRAAGIDNFSELLGRLQHAHDRCFTTIEELMSAMRCVSVIAGLKYRVPNV